MAKKTAITPTRAQNYPEWYQQVIKAAELAELSSVRGCMVIKPWGYGIWENIQRDLNERFKALGHENIYCPLFIPLSHMEKEAQHVQGFAKECAVVTHSRLSTTEDNRLIPTSPLEEPLIIRPTSETLIGEIFSGWVQSYRDLPILVNQWANIVRWEMRTRLFLRTSEFLWQEGHTVHATENEALTETLTMLDVYHDFAKDMLAIPSVKGEKSESERFPGAVNTFCIEALMQDNKALQAGTSHFLGQNFAKAFDIQYLNDRETREYGWTTSWGMSTRMIGGIVMTHSDDDGLILPPRIAPKQAVILPILHDEQHRARVLEFCDALMSRLSKHRYHDNKLIVCVDKRELRGGEKAWHWVKKGIPLRIEIGPKECEANQVSVSRRDQAYHERQTMSVDELCNSIEYMLDDIQSNLLARATLLLEQNTHDISNEKDFYDFYQSSNGFVNAHWCGDRAIEEKIKQDLGVTIRCLPLNHSGPGKCIFTGNQSQQAALFARAY